VSENALWKDPYRLQTQDCNVQGQGSAIDFGTTFGLDTLISVVLVITIFYHFHNYLHFV